MTIARATSVVAAMAALQPSAAGQGWTFISNSGPSPRYGHSMAFDSQRGRTVLFGGVAGNAALLSDTWEWDGTTWILVPAAGPTARVEQAMAFDGQRARVILFGGSGANGPLGDTWEWDGVNWTTIQSFSSPAPRTAAAMAYDSQRGRTVLFGGAIPSVGPLADTWEWDGLTWAQAFASGPSPRNSHAMAFDTHRGRTVLFGGEDSASASTPFLGDTWEWDGSTWTQSAAVGPSARSRLVMVYEAHRGRVIIHGGTTGVGSESGTWEWDGASWNTLTNPAAPTRVWHAMAYDFRRRHSLMFGGWDNAIAHHGDTWTFTGPVPATFTPFGQGCPSPTGTPQLIAAPGSLPIIGSTFTMQITNLPVSIFAVPFGAVGFSNQTFGGAPLPAPLDVIGATGCTLYVSIDQEFVLTNQSGTAAWNIPVPFDLSLIGLDAYVQGAVLVPGFNAANLVVANAGHVVVGWL